MSTTNLSAWQWSLISRACCEFCSAVAERNESMRLSRLTVGSLHHVHDESVGFAVGIYFARLL